MLIGISGFSFFSVNGGQPDYSGADDLFRRQLPERRAKGTEDAGEYELTSGA